MHRKEGLLFVTDWLESKQTGRVKRLLKSGEVQAAAAILDLSWGKGSTGEMLTGQPCLQPGSSGSSLTRGDYPWGATHLPLSPCCFWQQKGGVFLSKATPLASRPIVATPQCGPLPL